MGWEAAPLPLPLLLVRECLAPCSFPKQPGDSARDGWGDGWTDP